MPSYKTAFGSFLAKEDLLGKTPRVVVESVGVEDVKNTTTGELEKKLIMHFVGKDKALILNRTNCEAMALIAGTEDYGAWVGHAAMLFTDPAVKFGGKTVGGLRIGPTNGTAPVVAPPPPPPPSREVGEDDIPF